VVGIRDVNIYVSFAVEGFGGFGVGEGGQIFIIYPLLSSMPLYQSRTTVRVVCDSIHVLNFIHHQMVDTKRRNLTKLN